MNIELYYSTESAMSDELTHTASKMWCTISKREVKLKLQNLFKLYNKYIFILIILDGYGQPFSSEEHVHAKSTEVYIFEK